MARFESESFYHQPVYQIEDQFDIASNLSMEGWKDSPIIESGQQLLLLDGFHPRIKTEPRYFINGTPNALNQVYLREEAAERLRNAATLLPSDCSIIVFDAYRPINVQQEIFDAFKQQLARMHPDKAPDVLTKMTEVYVSLPSQNPDRPSPHSTGGAIDLSIVRDDGNFLEMGTDWDSFDISSKTNFFKGLNETYHNNRLLLYKIMTSSGFTNYPEEWWHYDFGNQFWAHISGTNAIYGGILEGGDDIYDRTKS
jgi:D-alanyl-D-alanine dipeptidase